jgi:hypothetical protein
MPGSKTTPSRAVLALGSRRFVLPSDTGTSSAPGDKASFAAQWWPAPPPADAPPTISRSTPHGTARGRCGARDLHRKGRSPPTPCQSPGAAPGGPTAPTRQGSGMLGWAAGATDNELREEPHFSGRRPQLRDPPPPRRFSLDKPQDHEFELSRPAQGSSAEALRLSSAAGASRWSADQIDLTMRSRFAGPPWLSGWRRPAPAVANNRRAQHTRYQ